MAFLSQKPNIHLSCKSYYHIQGSNQTNMSYPKQKHRHVKIKQTSYHIQGKAFKNIIHVHQGKIKIISQTNACSCECITYLTYLTVPQHLCINAWSYHMHIHGISIKEKRRNPNLTCEGQTTSKHRNRYSKTWKRTKVRTYYISEMKK